MVGTKAFGIKAGLFVHEYFGFVTYAIAIAVTLLAARLLREKESAITT